MGINQKKAYSLAEILITLGIIGVVATLTMQTLIANIKEKTTIKKVTQAYALLQQVDLAMREENGNYDTWLSTGNINSFEEKFSKHVEVVQTCKFGTKGCYFFGQFAHPNTNVIMLKNGLIIGFRHYNDNCTINSTINNYKKNKVNGLLCAGIHVSVNGPKRIVKGTDVFYFQFATDGVLPWGLRDGWDSFHGFDGCPNVAGYVEDTCAAWVVYNQNMDYLHCRNKLSWSGTHSCKDANSK